jgi:NitT/TauT family transport system ATP-binding protein/nitrate/nitrite transport system substrate-binding protein
MADVIRLGLLRLSDAAPLILADQEGIFATLGVRVELSVEPSWANIADKLGYGLLEGAVMLPPLAMACAAGLRGRKTPLVVPMSLSANGNAVTLAARLEGRFAAAGIAGVAGAKRLRLAVVHGFSTHDLLLRYWLAANGVDPDRDVEITVLPPAEMVGSLAADAVDGFCGGAPWGHVAAHAGLGFVAVQSREIWRDHPEKCLALRADFCARDPAGVQALLQALITAGALCTAPEGREALASLLAAPKYLDLPAPLIAGSLDPAAGGPVFTSQYPAPAHAAWFAGQLLRWKKAPGGILEIAAALYRPDFFAAAGGAAQEEREEVFCDG